MDISLTPVNKRSLKFKKPTSNRKEIANKEEVKRVIQNFELINREVTSNDIENK